MTECLSSRLNQLPDEIAPRNPSRRDQRGRRNLLNDGGVPLRALLWHDLSGAFLWRLIWHLRILSTDYTDYTDKQERQTQLFALAELFLNLCNLCNLWIIPLYASAIAYLRRSLRCAAAVTTSASIARSRLRPRT